MTTAADVGPHSRRFLVFLLTIIVIILVYLCGTFSDVILGSIKEYTTSQGNVEIENQVTANFPFHTPWHTVAAGLEDYDGAIDNDNTMKETNDMKKTAAEVIYGSKLKRKQSSPYIDKKLHLRSTKEIKNKTILWWNPPEWLKEWFHDINMDRCEYNNCRVSFSQKRLHESDAVVFSIAYSSMGYKPPVPKSMRNPNQAWIFFTLESPVSLELDKKKFMNPHWHNVFNWSWTYRTDSDIVHPYGTLITKEIIPKRNYSEIFSKKTKFAAWAVSHCRTQSQREKYVNLLNKYANVDIYGACGMKPPPDLKKFINNNYKFYFGFENSFCDEYMTEKFFSYYKMDLINIVRGKADYNRYLPSGSFINTADFPSVKALATFMNELGSNKEEYIKYLKLKDSYKVYEGDFMLKDATCSICEKLNNLEINRKTYIRVSDWLGSCYPVNDLKEFK